MSNGTALALNSEQDLASIPMAQGGLSRLAIARLKSAGVPVAPLLKRETAGGSPFPPARPVKVHARHSAAHVPRRVNAASFRRRRRRLASMPPHRPQS
jgi:hypothetical protein